jgi:hypothetical protein
MGGLNGAFPNIGPKLSSRPSVARAGTYGASGSMGPGSLASRAPGMTGVFGKTKTGGESPRHPFALVCNVRYFFAVTVRSGPNWAHGADTVALLWPDAVTVLFAVLTVICQT